MRASAAGLSSAGTWWNGTSYAAASRSRSRWLETIAGISMLSAPVLCR